MEVDVNEEITWKRYNHSLLSNNVLLRHYPKRYKQTKNCDDEKVEIFGTTCCGWNKFASIKLFFSPIYVSKTIVVITESKYYEAVRVRTDKANFGLSPIALSFSVEDNYPIP